MRKLILCLVFLLLFAVGCGAAAVYVPVTSPALTTSPEPEIVYLELFLERPNQVLGKYEPSNGVLLGVYIGSDPTAGNIPTFNATTGVDHAIFAHVMHLGDDFPLRWVLENIAASAAPFITLLPPPEGAPLNLELLESFAHDIALFNAPAFVQLFPLSSATIFNPSDYTAFFQQAYALFAEIAPNVALVWGFDGHMLAQASHFYPGYNSLHWINLTLYNEICPEGYFQDITGTLKFFEENFGNIAPLMLTTAVASYSMTSNRHFPAQAGVKIENLYESLANFPRIGAIIYQNYNDRAGRGADFRINTSTMLTTAYRNAAQRPRFLSQIPADATARVETTTQASPHRVVSRDFRFYIPTAAIYLDNTPQVHINGQFYHALPYVLEAKNADFFVNFQAGTITLQLP